MPGNGIGAGRTPGRTRSTRRITLWQSGLLADGPEQLEGVDVIPPNLHGCIYSGMYLLDFLPMF
jgi:hypothetical protein